MVGFELYHSRRGDVFTLQFYSNGNVEVTFLRFSSHKPFSVYVCICIYVCMYVCVSKRVCMCVYICMYSMYV